MSDHFQKNVEMKGQVGYQESFCEVMVTDRDTKELHNLKQSAIKSVQMNNKQHLKDENEQIHEAYDFTPLTKQSRVLRRGRGRRVEEEFSEEEMSTMSVPERRP